MAARRGKATIRDVAARAGVSVATVSRYVNRSGHVEEQTGARIQQAIAEVNYVPSMVASGLKTGRSRIVLLVVPDICNPFYSTMAKTVQQLVGLKGYAMALYNTNERASEEAASVQLARQVCADGILFASIDVKRPVIDTLTGCGISVVGLNFFVENAFDTVHAARIGGTYLTTQHLIGLGHRRIAFAGGLPGSAIALSRREGYARALHEAGLTTDESCIFEMGFSQADGYKAGCYFSTIAEWPTAICCANDLLALGVMEALTERGVRIPQDISVTGMDDIPYARTANPGLTTVTNDSAAFASEGVRMLFERIEGAYAGAARESEIAHQLVARGSTARLTQNPEGRERHGDSV